VAGQLPGGPPRTAADAAAHAPAPAPVPAPERSLR
jgi:hypothetical protein